MAEADLYNKEAIEDWLEGQELQVVSAISCRASLRVLANIVFENEVNFDRLAISCFRALLVSACHSYVPKSQFDWTINGLPAGTALSKIAEQELIHGKLPYLSAKSACFSVKSIDRTYFAKNAAEAIFYSIQSATVERRESSKSNGHLPYSLDQNKLAMSISYNVTSDAVFHNSSSIRASITGDMNHTGIELTGTVWDQNEIPPSLQATRKEFTYRLSGDFKWQFWLNWYLAMWEGRFADWDLAFEVIQIVDDVWEAGADAVAHEIERLQAKHFLKKYPLAETIQLNPETNRFYATPTPIQNAPLIGTLLSRVKDSVEDATLGNNGLNDQSREVRVLSRTLTRYANDPQRIEIDFTSVAVGLRRQIHDTAELPNSEGNLALLEAVEDGVRGIRAAHPDIAKNRLLIAQQSLHELSSEHVDLLKDAQPVLVAISEEIMAEDFAVDIPSLINDALQPLPNGAPPLPGADAATRIFNRASHMRLMYGQFIENGSKAFDSKTFKTARLALTVTSMLSALVSLGLFLFGVI